MGEDALVSLASIVVLGIGAQWFAWRVGLPSILLLLLAGFMAGPVTGLVDPDHLLGDTLFPVVSVSVGVILFEGGLTLRLNEIEGVRRVIFRLISVGMLVTWAVGALGAYFVVGLNFELSMLIGAIFTVSGPTVVVPLLHHVRPGGQTGSILKWEGILIDPVGATLAVLVFEIILAEQVEGAAAASLITGLVKTVLFGSMFGILGAYILIQVLKRYWVPEHLQNPVTVMLIVGAFALSNELQTESGLLATTLMGVILANQRQVSVRHISQFKEDLGVLLLSSLFVVLAARLDLDALSNLGVRALVFLGVLIFVARPLAVYVSTVGSKLGRNERVFLAWLAPRGIVAVSVASLFALELEEAGYHGAEKLVPLTFLVVVGTVATYGLTARNVAGRLGLAQPPAEGVLIVGAQSWAQAIAGALQEAGHDVLLMDNNWNNISAAQQAGLLAVHTNALAEEALDEPDLNRMGHLLALTANDEINSLVALRFSEVFARSRIYQLPAHCADGTRRDEVVDRRLCGRCLFSPEATFDTLGKRFAAGGTVKTILLTAEFDYAAFRQQHGDSALPLFVIHEAGSLTVFTVDNHVTPRVGQTVIALFDPR
ncbi:MAG: sodium:proton antiporter [Anaerolineae bacterium]|nr:sodium:proton antiporter [Anaerolineae bacterium]